MRTIAGAGLVRAAVAVLLYGFTASAGLCSLSLDEARNLHRAGDLDGALEAYRGVIEATETFEATDRSIAGSNSCVILMNRGEFPSALELCQAALELGRGTDDEGGLSRVLNNTALVLQYLGRLKEAEDRFEEALELNRRRDDVQSQAINLANLGVVAVSAEEYGRGLALHGAAAQLAADHPDEPWSRRQLAVAELNRGGVLESVGSYEAALGAYRRAESMRDQLDPRGRATLQMNLGVVYRNLGDPVLAIEAFEAAREAFADLQDQAGEANAWLNHGIASHLDLEDLGAAEAAMLRALELARESGDRRGEILALISLGHLRLDQGRPDEARRAFEICLRDSVDDGAAGGQWSAFSGLARVAAAEGDLLAAREKYGQAIDRIEAERASLDESPLRSGVLRDRRATYAEAADLLSSLDRLHPGQGFDEEALMVAQRAKSRDLVDVLGEGSSAGILPTASEIRAGLSGRLTLEYFVGHENLHLWRLDEDGIELIDLGPYRPILDAVTRLHRDLSANRAVDPEQLTELSKRLLGPVAGAMAGTTRLTVAADGGLFFLPFELLDDPLDGGAALVERVEVNYLPSVSSALRLGLEGESRSRAHLVLANPDLSPAGSEAGSPIGEMARRLNLAPLPSGEAELAAVLRWLPGEGRSAVGAEATETFFRRHAASGHRVVHFATHAVAETPSGLGAAILLAPSKEDDGLLEPREIAALDLPTRLTVLSACRTAMGPANRTGSLASLTGAFLAAGSPAVVATLWEVGDRTTAAFMDQFYFQLGRGLRPARALQQAKLALRTDPQWDRPGIWAAYVLIGDAGPLVPRAIWRRPVAMAVAAVLMVLFATWLVRRRSAR